MQAKSAKSWSNETSLGSLVMAVEVFDEQASVKSMSQTRSVDRSGRLVSDLESLRLLLASVVGIESLSAIALRAQEPDKTGCNWVASLEIDDPPEPSSQAFIRAVRALQAAYNIATKK